MILKDTLREIKKSFGRFFSIFAIVAIGVAFFAGIIATPLDMKNSAEKYFDSYNFMDFTIYSTFGLTEDDVTAIKRISGVEGVMATYSLDVMGRVEGENYEFVIRLHGIPENVNLDNHHYINQAMLFEGRMPENSNECVMVYEMKMYGLQIGEVIYLSSGNSTLLEESISIEKMTVVGFIQTPNYLSIEKGSSAIGRGSVDTYAFVSDQIFKFDYYTEVYVTVENSKQFDSFEVEYFDFLSKSYHQIKTVGREQSELRHEEILETIRNELAEKQEEYNEAVQKFENEISKAEKEIEDAKFKLLAAQITLDVNRENVRVQIENARAQLLVLDEVIVFTEQQYEAALAVYNDQYINIVSQRDVLQANLDQIQIDYPNLDARIVELSALQIAGTITVSEQQELDNLLVVQQERNQYQSELNAINSLLSVTSNAVIQMEGQLNGLREQYNVQSQSLVDMEQQASEGFLQAQAEIDKGNKDLISAEVSLNIEKKKAEMDLEDALELLKKAEVDIENIPNPEWYVLDRKSHYSYREYEGAADRIKAIGDIFPVFFFLVAALVSLTTMTRMVDEQRQTIGTLKALGYGKLTIALKYIVYAAIPSVLGAMIGLLVGLHLFPSVIFNAWNIMYTIPKLHLKIQAGLMILSAGIGIAVTVLAAIFACYKELMETPSLLMRPKAPKAGKKIMLERIPFIWKRLTFSEKVTMRNLFRYKKRLLMTVAGISGCTALILAGFGIRDSINSVITTQFNEIYQYDSTITFESDISTFEKEELLIIVNRQENVDDSMLISTDIASLYYDDKDISITLYIPTDIIQFQEFVVLRNIKSAEEYLLSDDGVIISQKMANDNGIRVGDTISIVTSENYQKNFIVDAIAENYVGDYVFMSAELYQKSYGVKAINTNILVRLQDSSPSELTSFSRYITAQDGVRSISFFSGMIAGFSDTISSLNIVIVVLIVSAGLLAFVVLYNLNNVNISERIREIATIKVLGFKEEEVSRYINRESILLTILGAIIGLVLGRVLHLFIMNVVELDQVMFTRDVFIWSHVFAFFITLAFGFIINFAMKFKLRKVPMVESLKSIE